MKHLSLLLLLTIAAAAQPARELDLETPPPPPVPAVSASLVGAQGNATYCYWVIAIYPIGKSGPSQGGCIENAPSTLTVSNYVRVNWAAAAGATGYDVIRSSARQFPGSCTACSVASNTQALTVNNTAALTNPYTFSGQAGTAKAAIKLNNRDYATPVLELPYAASQALQFAPVPVAPPGTTGKVVIMQPDGTLAPVQALTSDPSGNVTAAGLKFSPVPVAPPGTTGKVLIMQPDGTAAPVPGFTVAPDGTATMGTRVIKPTEGVNKNNCNGDVNTCANITSNAQRNVFYGLDTGAAITDGDENECFGWLCMNALTTGFYNTGMGSGALNHITTAQENTAVGADALATATSSYNTAFGAFALWHLTTGSGTAMGRNALASATTGTDNTGIGKSAMTSLTTGNENTAVGASVMTAGTFNGSGNTGVGTYSLLNATTGTYNTAVGWASID